MWSLITSRRALQAAAIMGVLLVVALWPEATEVEVGSVTRGALAVTIDGEGETRVHHRFIVSAPVAGTVERIELEPGHGVERGTTVVARLYQEMPQPLDARTRAEAAAAVEAARRAMASASAEEERARTALEVATTELERERDLFEAGQTTQQSLEARRNLVVSGEESVSAAQYGTAAAAAELDRARARLIPNRAAGTSGGAIEVLAPVDGVVLKRFHESEGVVAAGERLLEIGDPSHVEIVADLLSSDAAKVEPGMRVDVEHWGGDTPLAAWVERVEPRGSPRSRRSASRNSGSTSSSTSRTTAPPGARWVTASRFRSGSRFGRPRTYCVSRPMHSSASTASGPPTSSRTAAPAAVNLELGQRTNQQAEVRKGLTAGQQVVLHAPDTLTDNARVSIRQ